LTFAAAIAILREHGEEAEDNLNLLELYMADEDVIKEASVLEEHGMVSFRMFLTDDVAVNNAGGGAIDGIGVGPKGEPGGTKQVLRPLYRRKKRNALNKS
jgi:hypothetical protein